MTNQEALEELNYLISDECTDTHFDFIEEIKLGIKALEKQIPMKPTLGGAYKINEWECPNCKSYFAKLNDRPRYCSECGQALDWGD